MKSQKPALANNTRKLSDAALADRYLDLQRLRDEVRKAEASYVSRRTKKASTSNAAALLDYAEGSPNSLVRPRY